MKRLILVLLATGFLFSCKKKDIPSPEEQPVIVYPPIPVPNKDSVIDNFHSLNLSVWAYQLANYKGNGSNFIQSHVKVHSSVLELMTTVNENVNEQTPKPYNSGELEGIKEYLYGYFSARIKSDICPGTVSSFFLINAYQPVNWEQKEIDIQILGRQTTHVQCSVQDYQNGGADWKYSSKTIPLGFDAARNFHEYGILWTPDSIAYFVDNLQVYVDRNYIPHEKMHVRFNHYAGDDNEPVVRDWLGLVDKGCLPSSVLVDWIKYRSLEDYKTNPVSIH